MPASETWGRVDASEIIRLWELLPRPGGSVVRYMARKRSGDDRAYGDFVETVDDLIRAAETWQRDGYDFFIQLNPTSERARSRPSAQDVTHWSWFLIDIDPQETVPGFDPKVALEEALQRLSVNTGVVLYPTVVDSGRGMQAWIRLPDIPTHSVWHIEPSQPFDFGPLDYNDGVTQFHSVPGHRAARAAMGYWLRFLYDDLGVVAGCVVDTSVCDLPRVMRCPGTINTRTGRMARIVQEGTRHETLASKLLSLTPETAYRAPTAVASGPVEGRTYQEAWPLLNFTAQNFIREGGNEGSRHKAAVATVLALRDAGLTASAALAGVMVGNARCQPEPIHPRDIERMVDDAFRP